MRSAARSDRRGEELARTRATAEPTTRRLPRCRPTTVLVISNLGAPMLRYTPHRVLAGPYHRNVDGNLAALERLHRNARAEAARDRRAATTSGWSRSAAAMTRAAFLAERAPDGFWRHCLPAKSPDWLEIVPESRGKPLELYRVLPRALIGAATYAASYKREYLSTHYACSTIRFLNALLASCAQIQTSKTGTTMNPCLRNGQTGRESSDLAFTDPLTGLGNHRRFFDKVDRLISDRADDPAPFTVGILDLDGFKPINDLFGHKAGDDILVQVAMRLRAAMDGHSTVTRIGADEFAFLYPLVFSEDAAAEKAHMLIEILSAPYDVGERTARLSASVGCSLFHSGDETTEILVNKAETALYQAKRSGRGRVVVYTREMEEAAKRVTRIEQALRRAVSAGEVEPHFQPIVDLQDAPDGRLRDAGALDRPRPRAVSPVVFIPIAEERGIIGPLSQLVLRKATEAARNWPKDLFLSFNLSPSQLVDQNTGLHILAILDRTGFDPRRLEIEITETGLMTDPASAEKIVDDLRRCGIRVSLDDFGTGQSSLGRLREFHFDKLKIDRAFVASILEDRPSEHIIRAILAMCEGLGMDVVAEGIEQEAQAERLVQFGCGGGQGYLFGRPVNADATLGYLRDSFRGAQRARAV